MRVGSFVFDKTRPNEKACARYILDAPQGERTARMRRLILLGHAALGRGDRPQTSDTER